MSELIGQAPAEVAQEQVQPTTPVETGILNPAQTAPDTTPNAPRFPFLKKLVRSGALAAALLSTPGAAGASTPDTTNTSDIELPQATQSLDQAQMITEGFVYVPEKETIDPVEKAIKDWVTKDPVTGKYPVESMPYRFTDRRSFQILNLLEPWRGVYDFKTQTDMTVQGKLISSYELDGHEYVVLGFEDWGPSHDSVSVLTGDNERFTMNFDIGRVDDNPVVQTWQATTDNFLEGIKDLRQLSCQDMIEGFIKDQTGETVAGIFFPFKMSKKQFPQLKDPKYKYQIETNNAAVGITRKVVTEMYQLTDFDTDKRVQFSEANFSPEVARLINRKLTHEDLAQGPAPYLMTLINK